MVTTRSSGGGANSQSMEESYVDSKEEGNERFKKNDFKGAIVCYSRAIKALEQIAPQNFTTDEKDHYTKCLTNRAIAYFNRNLFEDCIEDCTAALEIDPAFFKARYRRALAYQRSSQWNHALEDFEDCLSQGCDDRKVLKDCQKYIKEIMAKMNVVQVTFSTPVGHRSSSNHNSDKPMYHPAIEATRQRLEVQEAPTVSSLSVKTNNRISSQNRSSDGPSLGVEKTSNRSRAYSTSSQQDEMPTERSRPSRQKQAKDVFNLLMQAKRSAAVGDMWALVPAQWWHTWQEYVNWEEFSSAMQTTNDAEVEEISRMEIDRREEGGEEDEMMLHAIDNSRLLERRGGSRLKEGLRRGVDWEAVPAEVWAAIQDWYGGGPAIWRPVSEVDDDSAAGAVELELFPSQQPFPTHDADNNNHHSKEGDDNENEDHAMEEEEEEEDRSCAMAVADQRQMDESSTFSSSSSRNVGDQVYPCLACQVWTTKRCSRCHKAFYCCHDCQASHWKYHRGQCRDDGKALVDLGRKGLVGLVNLGNTCYMNSALQCLSHTRPLTRHFLTNRFKVDLNRESALGTGGQMALDYDALIKELWFGANRVVNPYSLRKSIIRFQSHFAGNSQHDSHELLLSLLDNLHEDLNRVRKKPYFETPEYDKRSDMVQAEEAWQRTLKREDSVIVENFWGQFKSELVCPDCGYVSVVFEPFSMVTLEIPDINLRTLNILVFPSSVDQDSKSSSQENVHVSREPRLVTLHISRRATMWDVKQELQNVCGVSRDHLHMAILWEHRIDSFLRDNFLLTRFKEQPLRSVFPVVGPDPKFQLIAYEMALESSKEEEEEGKSLRYYLVLQHRRPRGKTRRRAEEEEGDDDGDMEMIGFPVLLSIATSWTCKEVLEYVWSQVDRLVDLTEEERKSPEVVQTLVSSLKLLQTEVDTSKALGEYIPYTEKVLIEEVLQEPTEGTYVMAMDWVGPLQDRFLGMKKPHGCFVETYAEEEEEEEDMEKEDEMSSSSVVTLDHCLKKFSNPERLDRDNSWYCSRCKKHKQAAKTLQLWRLPPILIITLKRFDARDRKLDTPVEFPLEGLDLSDHLPKEQEYQETFPPPIYDLFAVSNHYGSSRGWGHYTTLALGENRQWYLFDDSDFEPIHPSRIMSHNAYILFYKRREDLSSSSRIQSSL